MGILRWQTHLNPILAAALSLGLIVWLIILYRRQRRQHPTKQAVLLLVPKVPIVLMVVLAYFDPVWSVIQRPGENKKFLVLVDRSSSMGVEDEAERSRAKRADDLLAKLTQGLRWFPRSGGPSYADFDTLEFDHEVWHGPPARENTAKMAVLQGKQLPIGVRETDLGKCLVTIADKPDISNYMGAILITDGGDELVQNVKLPEVPVYITGVGSNPDTWNDVAITQIEAPEVVQEQSDFEVTADIVARCASNDFAVKIGVVKVNLEEKEGEDWQVRDTKLADLSNSETRGGTKFRIQSPTEAGAKKYRFRVETVEGELSELNNTREFSIEVRENTLPILLFAQELGWDFSMIRKELARDPLISLTTLYRINEDRFIMQGSRQEGDQILEAGFPSEQGVLGLYKCIIVGSLPVSQWRQEQLQALVEYVRQGGAAIFLGGQYSFAGGGYSGTAIEPLFPWRISDSEPKLQTGQFMVNVPLSAANHSIVSEMSKLISLDLARDGGQAPGATIDSINLCGPLRPGAINLLDATWLGHPGRDFTGWKPVSRTVPVVALQRYGQGQTMAVATNTLWKWTRVSEALQQAYGHFWRQAVRNLSQWEEGQRFLAVVWDQPSYKPGQRAQATIRVAGRFDPGQLHLKATFNAGDEPEPVSVKAVMGRDNTFDAEMVFSKRAEYLFEAHAYLGEKLLESYQKSVVVGPSLNEGANLEVDHAFLDNLAMRSGGAYFRETDFDRLIETLRSRVMACAVSVEIPLVQDKLIYILIFLGILMLEWTVRRKMNLF